MPVPASVADYIELIRKSGLIPDDRLHAELVQIRDAARVPMTIDLMATGLIRAGLLTRFQAKQLKLGRYKRFEIAGKYRLLELLGVGGMGAVYLCEHMFMKRLVALKVLPVDKLGDKSALLRFYREARAIASLDHPNIVRAHDIDRFEQLHFLVMEYVDGTSIQEIVSRNGPLDPVRAANYVAQAAHGLQHAYELGMVHRDIKPGNLLLDRHGQIKILDMGLARFFHRTNDNVTEKFDANCVLGTADYLAPEQAVSNVVDIRADIYSLGATLYFMLTGHSTFPEGTIAQKLMSHQSREPRPVADFRSDVPHDLLAILHRMLRKEPRERFQTPAELAEELLRWTSYPVPLPPVQEMPDLCPAVLALTGGSADRTRATRQANNVSRHGVDRSGIRSPLPGTLVPPGTAPLTDATPLPQSKVPTTTSDATTPITPRPELLPSTVNEIIGDSEVDLRAAEESLRLSRRPAMPVPVNDGRARWMLLGVLGGVLLTAVLAVIILLLRNLLRSSAEVGLLSAGA